MTEYCLRKGSVLLRAEQKTDAQKDLGHSLKIAGNTTCIFSCSVLY